MATTTTDTNRSPVVKKKKKQAEKKLSSKNKKQWAELPTCDLLFVFVNETFQSKARSSSKLPINDFIRYYNFHNAKGWMKSIVGNLFHFITFLSDPGYTVVNRFGDVAVHIDNIKTSLAIDNTIDVHTSCLSSFETKLNDSTRKYQATKDDLLSAVQNSFNARAATEPHPIAVFLKADNEVKKLYKGDDWLLHFLGRKILDSNDKVIATILYSLIYSTQDYNDIDALARSLGAKAKTSQYRRDFLNRTAHGTIKEYFEMKHTDDATATTASLSQSSATSTGGATASTASPSQSTSESSVTDTAITSSSLPHHRHAPTVITTNIEKGTSNFNIDDNISPLTIPPSSSETTTSFSFASPLKSTPHNCGNMSLGPPPGSPPLMQHSTPHNNMSLGSPTPTQVTKKTRVGQTPDLNAPSNRGDRRVLFADNDPITARTAAAAVGTATASIPAPTSVSERARAASVSTSSSAWATTTESRSPRSSPSSSRRRRLRKKNKRIRGGGVGGGNALSSTSVSIDKEKFGDDMTVCGFIDRLGKTTSSKQLVDCTIDFLSDLASSSDSENSITSRYNMLIKVRKPRKIKENAKRRCRRKYIRLKGKEMYNAICATVPNSDMQKDVLSYILKKNYGADIYYDKVKQQCVSVADLLAVRIRGGHGVSNNALNQMLQDVVRLFKHYNMLRVNHPLPGGLRAKMGRAEAKGTIPVDYQVIRCSTGKDKTEMCTHNWIRTIPLLVEKLVATCIAQGKYEESILFSKLLNKILLGIGADRGGGDLINLIRLLNRMDGNCAKYSIPLAVVEKAAEDYAVLAKTLYNKRAKDLLEPLLNDELHMFVMRCVNDVKCLAVRFIRDGKPTKSIISCVDKECERMLDGFVFDSIANTRRMWNDFDISNIMDDTEIEVKLNPITNSKEECIGVRVCSNDGTSLTHRFDSPVIASSFESVDCKQVQSVPVEDSKLGSCLYGQSTCSVARPCFRCIWDKRDERPTMWLSNHGFAVDECHPVELREGSNSREKCWKRFQSLMGENERGFVVDKEKITKDTREKCNSISKKPLLRVDDLDKHHGEPMHVAQGMLTHLNTETYKKLNEESEGGEGDFYYDQAELCQQYIMEVLEIEESVEFKDAKIALGRFQVDVRRAMDGLKTAEEVGDENLIRLAEENLEELEARRNAVNAESNYTFKVRLVRGAKEFDALIDSSENNKKTRMTQQAFLFRSAIRMHAGFYTAMHETMELTGRRGILMLDFRQKIHHFVVNGGFVHGTGAIVQEIMDEWLALSTELHPISILCNDQSKLDDAKLTKFEGHISAFIKLWIPFIGGYKNWQYYKLHSLTCGAVAFGRKYGMLGRANAQGFENKHFELNHVRETLSRIPQRKLRVQKLAQRSQTMFIDGLTESLNFFQRADDDAKRGARGKYNTTVNRTRRAENIQIYEEEETAPDGYFTSDEGNLIPSEWEQLYHFVKFGKAPAEWRKTFEDDDEVGTVDTVAAGYLQPISGGRP